MKDASRGAMVGYMTSMFNIAAGVVGAIIGGAIGASWAMTQSVVYRMGITADACNPYSGLTPDQFLQTDAANDWNMVFHCRPYEVYDWNWLQVAPVTLTAALVGAFTVLLGVGILRKVYGTSSAA